MGLGICSPGGHSLDRLRPQLHLAADRCRVVGEMSSHPHDVGERWNVGYVAASDTKPGRFIHLVEYL